MKTLIGAIALILSAPVAAQTAPAAAHTGHGNHQSGSPANHSEHHPAGDHSQHKGDCCKDAAKHKECCVEAVKQGKKMECCEKDGGKAATHAGHSSH